MGFPCSFCSKNISVFRRLNISKDIAIEIGPCNKCLNMQQNRKEKNIKERRLKLSNGDFFKTIQDENENQSEIIIKT